MAVGEEAEVADALEAVGQRVQQAAADVAAPGDDAEHLLRGLGRQRLPVTDEREKPSGEDAGQPQAAGSADAGACRARQCRQVGNLSRGRARLHASTVAEGPATRGRALHAIRGGHEGSRPGAASANIISDMR